MKQTSAVAVTNRAFKLHPDSVSVSGSDDADADSSDPHRRVSEGWQLMRLGCEEPENSVCVYEEGGVCVCVWGCGGIDLY